MQLGVVISPRVLYDTSHTCWGFTSRAGFWAAPHMCSHEKPSRSISALVAAPNALAHRSSAGSPVDEEPCSSWMMCWSMCGSSVLRDRSRSCNPVPGGKLSSSISIARVSEVCWHTSGATAACGGGWRAAEEDEVDSILGGTSAPPRPDNICWRKPTWRGGGAS